MSSSELDRSDKAGGEQRWLVVTARQVSESGGLEVVGEAHVTVTAATMTVVEGGTLVFRGPRGELSWAFGPGGWLEVSRA